MFGSSLLGVVIGLDFFFLLLSIIATALQELLASRLNLRGRNLLKALQELIRSERQRETFFDQPEVFALFRGGVSPPGWLSWAADLLATAMTFNGFDRSAPRPERMPGYMDGKSFAAAAATTLASVAASATSTAPTAGAAPALVAKLKQQGVTDTATFAAELEKLFDRTMERASGWYKRQAQYLSLLVGLLLATALNADAIFLARQLWADDALRASVTRAAEDFYAANRPTLEAACRPDEPDKVPDACAAAFAALGTRVDDVRAAGFPLGWADGNWFEPLPRAEGRATIPAVGIVLTALALSLGSAFWFDLLERFINLRGAANEGRKLIPHPPRGKRATTRNGATRWVWTNSASWSTGTGPTRWGSSAASRISRIRLRSGSSSGPVSVMWKRKRSSAYG